ncbi:MAG: penicillin-binding protein 1A [Alphaproteobacteria bacterium]
MFKTLILVGTMASATHDLPPIDIATNYQPTKQMYVSNRSDVPLFEFGTHRWGDVQPEKLPKHVIDAFLAAEDQRFYRHKGVDLKSLFRASMSNVGRVAKGQKLLGASTITQQTAKIIFTDRARTLSRKMREALMAVRMERLLDKNDILRIYLNEVYFGQGATGLYDAAINYFSVPPERLTVAQAAFLATLPKAPSALSSKKQRARAEIRRDWILSRMQVLGMIDKDTRNKSQSEEIAFRNKVILQDNLLQTDYVEDALAMQLEEMFEPWLINQGGFKIKSTIDDEWQRAGYRAVRAGLERYDHVKGWRGPVDHINMSSRRWRFDFLRKAETAPLSHWRTALVIDADADFATLELRDGGLARLRLKDQPLLKKVEYLRTASIAGSQIENQTRNRTGNTKKFYEKGYGANGFVLKVGDLVHVRRPKEYVAAQGENPDQWYENAELISRSRKRKSDLPELELIQRPVIDGGLVAIENDSGRILSMIGGYSYEFSQFNRVTQAKRQPGSTVKPIIYLTALRKGWSAKTKILDTPVTVYQPGRKSWRPSNYDKRYKGNMLLRDALAQSRNIPAVKTAMAMGLPAISDTAKRLGVYEKPLDALPAALGARETTLKKMAGAYATIANGGTLVTPTLIQSVRDRNDRLLHDGFEAFCPACADNSWYKVGQRGFERDMQQLSHSLAGAKNLANANKWESHLSPPIQREAFDELKTILQDVVTRGTARGIRNRIPEGSGGKTGTTNGFKDAWFIGFSGDVTIAVHAGYDQPKSLGGGWTGGRLAAPIYASFVEQTLQGKNPVGGLEGYLASLPPKPKAKPYEAGTRLLANLIEEETENFASIDDLDNLPSKSILNAQKPAHLRRKQLTSMDPKVAALIDSLPQSLAESELMQIDSLAKANAELN